MEHVESFLAKLDDRHHQALRWYLDRAGQIHPYPRRIVIAGQETLLAAIPKGIYKPKWTKYALSVKQTLNSPYPDREPVVRPDGTWLYEYHQENDPSATEEFTNRGLVACREDRVPVGVMRQVSRKPHVRYHVLGLALVTGWDAGYFSLEGFSPSGACQEPGPAPEIQRLTPKDEERFANGTFDPAAVSDARERMMALLVRRLGQDAFRSMLIKLYRGRCALTGCDVPAVLEAAHVTPYLGPATNHATNGILLRSDIHTLFDQRLIAIDPITRQVIIAPILKGTMYGELEGRVVAEPEPREDQPSVAALIEHLRWTKLRASDEG